MAYSIRYEGKVPSKKNQYEIRFSRLFLNQFYPQIKKLKSTGARQLYWITPSKQVKEFENSLATIIFANFGAREKQKFENKEIAVKVRIQQTRSRDADNALGAIGDAIQAGIPGFNDRNIKKWDIEIEKGLKDLLDIDIEIL